MDEKKLINVYEARKILNCTTTNVWQLIRWQSLKAVKVDGKLHTCREWIDEYLANKHDRQVNSTYNGRKVFNEDKGILSMKTVCQETGLHLATLQYHVNVGNLKVGKKGKYRVVTREELDRFIKARGEQLDMFKKEKNA